MKVSSSYWDEDGISKFLGLGYLKGFFAETTSGDRPLGLFREGVL